MSIRTSKSEMAVWGALALAGGCFAGWLDLSATAAQSTALVLMAVSFALVLPGRAPAPLVAVLASIGIPLVHAAVRHDVNPGLVVVLVPAFIAAYGGRFAGRLLDTAASSFVDVPSARDAPWYDRPLSTRFILAVALTAIAAVGVPVLRSSLESMRSRAPLWVALVWQIMTWLGWILVTPVILARRRARTHIDEPGVRFTDVVMHAVAIIVLAMAHSAIILALSAGLFIPIAAGWNVAWSTALTSYLPLDFLAYLAILALAAASDAEQNRRASAQRETELRASALESRLAAIRARLNPHFLFNALNSVAVLARAGRIEETGRVLEGLTELLRYVLDDRSADVSLVDEIAFVRRYLEVQQVRFGDRLRYEIQYDESLDARVPRLLLQPIVENAVEHGVAESLDGGTVRISAARADGVLRLIVDDDGPGATTDGAAAGIGLGSTRERLATLYGDRARLDIGPRPAGGGTRVEIQIHEPSS